MPSISNLPAATALGITETAPVVQGTTTKKATLAQFITAIFANLGGAGVPTASGARTSLGAAGSGANSDITSITGLSTPLALSQGGTAATTAATARTSLVVPSKTEIQNQTYTYFTTGGTSTAYTLTPTPAVTAYAAGQSFNVVFHTDCGNTPTINISGLGAIGLFRVNSNGLNTTLVAGDIIGTLQFRVTLTSAAGAIVENLPANRMTLGPAAATTSGTTVDVSSIPTWVKKITVTFSGLSTNGTSIPMIQIGDNGGIETAGYNGTSSQFNTIPSVTVAGHSTGFLLTGSHAATVVYHGTATLTLLDLNNNIWAFTVLLGRSDVATAFVSGAGTKALSNTLNSFRLTTVAGVDTFDAGSFSYILEG